MSIMLLNTTMGGPGALATHASVFVDPTPALAFRVVMAVLLIFIILASCIGNCVLVRAVYLDSRMRTATNVIIQSQSVADLCTTVLVIPFALVSVITDRWIFGHTFCILNGFFNMYFTVITILNLSVIAFDRYLAIVKSSHHKIKHKAANYTVVFVWTSALVPGVPLLSLLSGKVRMIYFDGFYVCGQLFLHPIGGLELGMLVLLFTVFVLCPLGVIIFSFNRILKVIHGNRKRISPATLSNSQKIAVEVYAKSAHTSMLVIVTSLLQVFPACIALTVDGLQLIDFPRGFETTSKWIMWCHCIVKPVIYATRHRALSKKFAVYLKGAFCFFRESPITTIVRKTSFFGDVYLPNSQEVTRRKDAATPSKTISSVSFQSTNQEDGNPKMKHPKHLHLLAAWSLSEDVVVTDIRLNLKEEH